MKLVHHIGEIPYDNNSVITVGTFDGVHIGHQKIICEVVGKSKERKGRSIIVTFDPHPREIIEKSDKGIRLLTTLQERQEICSQLGVDYFFIIDFNLEFSRLNFRDFYLKNLLDGIGVSMVVEGYDHHWGREREGNIDALIQLGKEYGFGVMKIEPFMHQGTPVNSSMIREKLNNGLVEQAAELLGRPYAMDGKVVIGEKRGRSLGYPTANLELHSPKKLIPKDGIYFVHILIDEGEYYGMASIGIRPTFQENKKRTIEVNILDFDKDIYGREIKIELLRRLRDELKFESVDKLVQQIHKDEESSRKLIVDYQSALKN